MTDQEILAALRDLGEDDKSAVSEYIVSLQQLTNVNADRERAEASFRNADARSKEVASRHTKAASALAARLRDATAKP